MGPQIKVIDAFEPAALFEHMLNRAVRDGLVGAALVDRDGKLIGRAGELDADEARPLASFVLANATKDQPFGMLAERDWQRLSTRLFAGEVLIERIGRRNIAVAIAGRQLYVVAVLGGAHVGVVEALREAVERSLFDDEPRPPWSRGGGFGGSGPDDLALIEFGVTVPRAKA